MQHAEARAALESATGVHADALRGELALREGRANDAVSRFAALPRAEFAADELAVNVAAAEAVARRDGCVCLQS